MNDWMTGRCYFCAWQKVRNSRGYKVFRCLECGRDLYTGQPTTRGESRARYVAKHKSKVYRKNRERAWEHTVTQRFGSLHPSSMTKRLLVAARQLRQIVRSDKAADSISAAGEPK